MNDQDKKEFLEVMAGAGEIYNKSISKVLLRMFFAALEKYELSDVKDGFSAHVTDDQHGSFFPYLLFL